MTVPAFRIATTQTDSIDWIAEARETRAELADAEHRFAEAHRAGDPIARHISRHVIILRGRLASLRDTIGRIGDKEGVLTP